MNLNLKEIPNTPGIYKFFSKSEIIYIGKAKNLKKESQVILEILFKMKNFTY